MTIKDIKNGIRGVFVQPKKIYYLGKIIYGTPYFTPWNFNSSIFTIRKERPKFLRCKYFKLFGYEISYGWPVYIYWGGLGWKDKWNSPRFEWSPAFYIFFFGYQFTIHCDKDLDKAKKKWGWEDNNGNSTWDNKYLM